VSLLVISPDFLSHYRPLGSLSIAARSQGHRVVVATGPNMRNRVEDAGLEWRPLHLSRSANSGIASIDPGIRRFIDATRDGPIATLRRQALDREQDLLWEPERVAVEVADLCDSLAPDRVLVDHVSFGSTLAMYATGRRYVTLVPGHPSQLPVRQERYGIPTTWPWLIRQDPSQLKELEMVVDRVTDAFTTRWNSVLAAVAPDRPQVDDAFRVHGDRVLFNSVRSIHEPTRLTALPKDHRFIGPLVRDERLPDRLSTWSHRVDDRLQVYVAFGTFLSHRSEVLARVADALRDLGVRAAIASGPTDQERLGHLPGDWLVAPQLPQVAMLASADLIVHHGGNNTVQEALAAGVRQVVLPFSTDQFSNAADLERLGLACVLSANEATVADLVRAIDGGLQTARPQTSPRVDTAQLVDALFE
jgi:zeaxanthin glucosyltransferase